MPYETVTYDIAEAVATITLSRPTAYNALDLTLARELFAAALEADEDRAVRCVVITGAGNAFCAGGDVKAFHESADRAGILIKRLTTYLHGAVSRLARSPKPVIMAVNGIAAGGGMSLALAGDLVVAAESAKFNMAYSKIAASPDGSSTYFLPRMIGLRRSLELHYTNRTLSAREAMDWGLVNRVYPDAEFRAATAAFRASWRRGRPPPSAAPSCSSISRRRRAWRPRWSSRRRRSRRAARPRTSGTAWRHSCRKSPRGSSGGSWARVELPLELYVAWRAAGLQVETPGVRR